MTAPAPPADVLPTSEDLKAYLKIETSAEDVLCTQLVEDAISRVETIVGKSLRTETVSWVDRAISFRLYDAPPNLILREPVDASTVVVTDGSGDIVDQSSYDVDNDRLLIQGKGISGTWPSRFTFNNGPYTIAATAGLGTLPTYNTRILPAIRRVVIDLAAFWYQQRTPGASRESSAGTNVDYGEIDKETGLPTRVLGGIRLLRGVVVSAL